MPVELFGTSWCPHCAAARDELEWRGEPFVVYDVEHDRDAFRRMMSLTGGQRTVPVIAEPGNLVQIGWAGQGCHVQEPTS